LKINDALIAIFPAVSSVAMLALLFLVIPRFKINRAHMYMIGGFLLAAASKILLVTIAPGQITLAILSTILAAAGNIMATPYLEAVVANSIEDEQRAKMFSILQVLVLFFISPSGLIGGWTYTLDPRLPFMLIILSFVFSIVLMMVFMPQEGKKSSLEG
jgi:DHA1 family tetracycline resistance protein-like MFS transporter